MSIWGRLKSLAGAQDTVTIATSSATTALAVPDEANVIYLTGSNTVTTITGAISARGRIVWFFQSTGTTTFTNNPGTSTVGQMDLSGLDPADVLLGPTDWLILHQKKDGTWIRVLTTNN